MNIIMRFRHSILLIFFLAGTFYCCGQQKTSFYNKQRTLASLKESVLKAIDSYPKDMDLVTDNFRTLMSNYFDSTSFANTLDTLNKLDNGSFSNYYIVISAREGEMTVVKVLIRGYSKTTGKEIVYHLVPTDRKELKINTYTHNKRVFNNVFKKMKPLKGLLGSSDLFSISVYKKGDFETKLFKANRLTPEYFDKINALLGDL